MQNLSIGPQRQELISQHHFSRYGAEELWVDVELVQRIERKVEAFRQLPCVLLLFLFHPSPVEHDKLFFEIGISGHNSSRNPAHDGEQWMVNREQ